MLERTDEVRLLLSTLEQIGEDPSRFSPIFMSEVMQMAICHLADKYPLPPAPPACREQMTIYNSFSGM